MLLSNITQKKSLVCEQDKINKKQALRNHCVDKNCMKVFFPDRLDGSESKREKKNKKAQNATDKNKTELPDPGNKNMS